MDFLSSRFADYLARPTNAHTDALASALTTAPSFAMEAALLRRWAEHGAHATILDAGHWAARRVHIGPTLPPPIAGELWFDPCEVTTMVVLPARSWISVRPVARWQFAGFLKRASTRKREAREPMAVSPLDPTRILVGDEIQPVLRATISEAALYSDWFGKLGSNELDWAAALRVPAMLSALWRHDGKEWVGGDSQLEMYAALEKSDLEQELDYRAMVEAEDDRFFGAWDVPGDIAFRTAVQIREGLRTAPLLHQGPIELLDANDRGRWVVTTHT